jgi:hypothetical protein
MLSIEIRTNDAFYTKLKGYTQRTQAKYNAELDRITDLIFTKVIENLSGKILEPKTGQLRDSIVKETHHSGYDFIGFVGPVPTTAKAYALEFGGRDWYLIPIGERGVLANKAENFFSKSAVGHPPSKEYAYLRSALNDVLPEIDGKKFFATFEEGF